MSDIKFGARLSRVVVIQSQETAKGTVLTGVTREGKEPYQRYVQLTPIDELKWKYVRDTALECERLGFWSVTLPHHLRMEGGPRYENWTMLSALAAITNCCKLHHLVLCNNFFYPPLLAKAVITIDHISQGRFILGIGAGYAKEEFLAYGYDFPSPGVRIAQLDESLTLMKKMWTEEHPTFKGKYYNIENATGNPEPFSKPHPPILIGGSGPKMMRLAAKHANIVNLEGKVRDYKTAKKRMDILEKACKKTGRDFNEITKSWGSYIYVVENEEELEKSQEALSNVPKGSVLTGTPEEIIDVIQNYVDIGFTYFTFRFEDLPDFKGLQLFAKHIIPAF
jgi:probable F420-dependent oxidoreductase